MQHFIINADLNQKVLHVLDKEVLHQMKTVLRFKVGQELMVMDGQGTKAKARLLELHKKGALLELSDPKILPAPPRQLRLAVAISKKPSTFELILQKATEIGVTDIIPLVTERSQVRELRKMDRLEAIIKEAAEQCERAYLPVLHKPCSLNELSGRLLVGDARETRIKLTERDLKGDLTIVIGPEGGLSHEELAELEARGAEIFFLGENVLRMETATIAALSLVQFI